MDPVVSVPKMLNYIDTFSKLLGYSINWNKSEFMPLTNNLSDTFLNNIPFKIVKDHFTFLGLKIPKIYKYLFKLHFLDMFNRVKLNIESWKLLPLSLIGRVNVTKMVVLPKFLYLFQNIPIYLPATFFKQLDSVILSFVWNYKTPHIAKAHVQKPTDCGGLGLF